MIHKPNVNTLYIHFVLFNYSEKSYVLYWLECCAELFSVKAVSK